MNWTELAIISVIVVLVSVLATLEPAFKASRMKPIEALRHV
jgi:putative ABC transport system permease protein